MDKLNKPIFSEDWTAAEELALVDHTKRMGLGSWEELSDMKLFYRRKTDKDLNARYLDTYLSTYDSVLPPHYLRTREDGTVEEVPIAPTHPHKCPPALRGVKLDSREVRSRTIAELGTNPQYRYEPSWQALAKKQEDAKKAAREAAATAAGSNGTKSALANGDSGGGGGGGGGGGNRAGSAGGGGGAAAGGGVDDVEAGGGAVARKGESEECAASGSKSPSAAAAAVKSAQKKRGRRRVPAQNKTKEDERALNDWKNTLPGADLSVYSPLRGDFDHEHDNSAEELLANMEFRKTDHASERQLKLDVIAVYNHRLDEREKRKKFVIDHGFLDYNKQQIGGKKRTKEDRELIAKLRPLARFSTPEDHEELIDNLLLAKKMRMRIEQLQVYRQNGITTLAEGALFDTARKRRQEELASKKHRESASYLYDAHGSGSSKGTMRERNNRYTSRRKDGGSSDGKDGEEGGDGENLMDITGAPGYEYLSPAERLLCSQLHMTPGPYLAIKHAMIQECARAGFLKKNNISRLSIIETSRLNKMYDFFSTCGWITDKEMPLDSS
eukprot:g16874.t1